MKINSRALAATFAAFLASAQMLTADTVLWYRFEEHESGYTMTSTDRVTNEVDAATMQGVPVSNIAKYWPSYAASPHGYEGVYDPVSGKIYPNATAISLPQTVSSDNGLSEGPHIETPDCAALHLQSFTIEMFAQRNGTYRPNECLVRKLCNTGADTRCNYYIYRAGLGGNNHYAQVCVTDETEAFSSGHWKNTTGSNIADGDKLAGNLLNKKEFWDHIALTYDASTRTATLYRNYVVVKSFTFAEGFSKQIYIDKPLQIGGGGQNIAGTGAVGTNFGGLLDEVRISDTVLAPSQFLRMCSPNALPETTHYVDFSASTNFSAFVFSTDSSAAFRGCFANSAPIAANNRPEGAKFNGKTGSGIVADGLPGGATRPGLLSDAAVVNEAAAHVLTNVQDNTNSGYIKVPGLAAVADASVTIEFFFKAKEVLPQDGAVNGDAKDQAYLLDLGLCNLTVLRKYREVNMRLYGNNYGHAECGDSLRIDDVLWHHLAYVYDRDEGSEVFYLDGTRIFGQQTEALKSGSHILGLADGSNYFMVLGNNTYSSVNGGYTMTDTVFDEIRITKKALRPHEFLTSIPKENNGNLLAWYSFENDSLANGVYDDFIGAGALSAGADFSTKTPGGQKEIRDSERNKIRDNFKSLEFAGGKAIWPRNSILEREDMTVEFFARQKSPSAGAGLVTLLCSSSGTATPALAASDAIWSIRIGNDGRTPDVYVNNGTAQTVAFPATAGLGAGWRQYAVSFIPSGGDTTVKIFCDDVLVKTDTITGTLQIPPPNGGALPVIGGVSGGTDPAFNGYVDEVRISAGEVAVADMLYAPGEAGTIITVR